MRKSSFPVSAGGRERKASKKTNRGGGVGGVFIIFFFFFPFKAPPGVVPPFWQWCAPGRGGRPGVSPDRAARSWRRQQPRGAAGRSGVNGEPRAGKGRAPEM